MTLYYFKSLLQKYKNYDKKTNSQEVKKIDKRKSDKERAALRRGRGTSVGCGPLECSSTQDGCELAPRRRLQLRPPHAGRLGRSLKS